MPQSPLTEKSNLFTFGIFSNGTEMSSQFYDQVIEITVDQEINQVARAEIFLKDGNVAMQSFPIADSGFFVPGAEIEVQLGYEGQNQSVFKGLVTKVLITVDEWEGSRLRVICQDKAAKATIVRKNLIYTDQTDSDIVQTIASSYSLSTNISSTSTQNKEMVQFYATDWDFIVSRAEVNGMVIVTDSGSLVMAKPKVSDPALGVTYGVDIVEFDCELDASYQLSAVKGNTWDMSGQAIINVDAASPDINEQGNISTDDLANVLAVGTSNLNTGAYVDQDSLQSWADSALLKSGLSRFQGTILFQGSALAKANSTIAINGLSARFNGNAYISGVSHRGDEKGWYTEVKIGMSEKWYAETSGTSMPIASGLIQGVKGLQIGVVKKIDQDPDNEFRLQVQIPILNDPSNSVWARLSSFYTGNTFGAFFMPEINDEVILGFVNDDPRFPIVLGSVYSTKIASPVTPDDTNSIKMIMTSSQLQIKFDDKNKVITVQTPAGNTIKLDEQNKGIFITDQSQNSIQMTDQGITIESKSNMTLKAAQGITLQANTITETGTQSVSVSAPSVSITGDESATFTGNGECSISSDGETSIKGTAVMIN